MMADPAPILVASLAEVEDFIKEHQHLEDVDIEITDVVVREASQMLHVLRPKQLLWDIGNYVGLSDVSQLEQSVKASAQMLSKFLADLDDPEVDIAEDDTELLRESGQSITALVGGDPGLAHALRDLQIGEHVVAAADALDGTGDVRGAIQLAARRLSAVPNLNITWTGIID